MNRYEIIENGSEVKDNDTGLIWARCSVGQEWDGETCVGEVKEMEYDDAMEYADKQEGWRMPTIEELEKLIDRRVFPAIDNEAFPETRKDWYWSSSPYAGNSNFTWVVDFYDGGVSYGGHNYDLAVRLVKGD